MDVRVMVGDSLPSGSQLWMPTPPQLARHGAPASGRPHTLQILYLGSDHHFGSSCWAAMRGTLAWSAEGLTTLAPRTVCELEPNPPLLVTLVPSRACLASWPLNFLSRCSRERRADLASSWRRALGLDSLSAAAADSAVEIRRGFGRSSYAAAACLRFSSAAAFNSCFFFSASALCSRFREARNCSAFSRSAFACLRFSAAASAAALCAASSFAFFSRASSRRAFFFASSAALFSLAASRFFRALSAGWAVLDPPPWACFATSRACLSSRSWWNF